eukprot:sb/3463562/
MVRKGRNNQTYLSTDVGACPDLQLYLSLVSSLVITDLLRAPKEDIDQLPDLLQTCTELNSMQVGTILRNYKSAADEPPVTREFIEAAVSITDSLVDVRLRAEGEPIQLLLDDPFIRYPIHKLTACNHETGLSHDLETFFNAVCECGKNSPNGVAPATKSAQPCDGFQTFQTFQHYFKQINLSTDERNLFCETYVCVTQCFNSTLYIYIYIYISLSLALFLSVSLSVSLSLCLFLPLSFLITDLLRAPKEDIDQLPDLLQTCTELNSMQVGTILRNYKSAADEPPVTREFIEAAVSITDSLVDVRLRAEGEPIQLLLDDPFIRYPIHKLTACNHETGLSHDLETFFNAVCECEPALQLTVNPDTLFWCYAQGLYQSAAVQCQIEEEHGAVGKTDSQNIIEQCEVVTYEIPKRTKSLGVSIVGGKDSSNSHLGIFVKNVFKDGPAYMDGRLKPGDQILVVGGISTSDITQEQAAKLIDSDSDYVRITVAKMAAAYYGIFSEEGASRTSSQQSSPNLPSPETPGAEEVVFGIEGGTPVVSFEPEPQKNLPLNFRISDEV